jgi:ATP-dependent protease ClpP protease subunit
MSNGSDFSHPLTPTKTPMYQAIHADRYRRQALIKDIEKQTGKCLICYISGVATHIDRDDIVPFVDLLHNVQQGTDLDFLLHTPGGDMDSAEKLISLVHKTVGLGELRIIVPDFAKSAGTLMALGANKIVMSDTSELGPIDPQIALNDGKGNRIVHSVMSYLDAFKTHSDTLRQNPNDVVAQIMLSKLEPATIKQFEAVRDRARKCAENQLNQWMFQNKKANYTAIVADLLDSRRWLTHGQMISWEDAQQLELEVEYLDPRSELWLRLWELYCLQRLAIKDHQKLFESNYASLIFDGPVST